MKVSKAQHSIESHIHLPGSIFNHLPTSIILIQIYWEIVYFILKDIFVHQNKIIPVNCFHTSCFNDLGQDTIIIPIIKCIIRTHSISEKWVFIGKCFTFREIFHIFLYGIKILYAKNHEFILRFFFKYHWVIKRCWHIHS